MNSTPLSNNLLCSINRTRRVGSKFSKVIQYSERIKVCWTELSLVCFAALLEDRVVSQRLTSSLIVHWDTPTKEQELPSRNAGPKLRVAAYCTCNGCSGRVSVLWCQFCHSDAAFTVVILSGCIFICIDRENAGPKCARGLLNVLATDGLVVLSCQFNARACVFMAVILVTIYYYPALSLQFSERGRVARHSAYFLIIFSANIPSHLAVKLSIPDG